MGRRHFVLDSYRLIVRAYLKGLSPCIVVLSLSGCAKRVLIPQQDELCSEKLETVYRGREGGELFSYPFCVHRCLWIRQNKCSSFKFWLHTRKKQWICNIKQWKLRCMVKLKKHNNFELLHFDKEFSFFWFYIHIYTESNIIHTWSMQSLINCIFFQFKDFWRHAHLDWNE